MRYGWTYTWTESDPSRITRSCIKTISRKEELHSDDLPMCLLYGCCSTATSPCSDTPRHKADWSSAYMDVGFACVLEDVCIFQETFCCPVPAQMHYSMCHSQAGGSRPKSVNSLNPVNVEQHLIRSALYQAAACNDALYVTKYWC